MRRTKPLCFRPSRYAAYATKTPRDLNHAPIIQINSGTFYRHHPSTVATPTSTKNPPLYPDLTFELPSRPLQHLPEEADKNFKASAELESQQQHWAIIGSSGKATFLEILRGQLLCFPPTARTFPFLSSDLIEQKDHRLRFPGHAIQYVGFSGERGQNFGGTRGAYLSARYESRREDTDWTVLQYLKGDTDLNPPEEQEGKDVQDNELLEQVIEKLRLQKLVSMPVGNLSNGQTRRARIARALLGKPEVLLLDEPFMGLDPPTLTSLSPILRDLAYNSSPRLIMSLRPQDPIPDWMTHLVILGNDCTIALAGDKTKVLKTLQDWRAGQEAEASELSSLLAEIGQILTPNGIIPAPAVEQDHEQAQEQEQEERGKRNRLLKGMRPLGARNQYLRYDLSQETEPTSQNEPLVEMSGVVVRYGPKTILGKWIQPGMHTPGLYWNILPGSRWGLFGSNGSGKTTLLSLITSDHPQAYSLPVKHFGRARLPQAGVAGISIFDIQSRIGHSSPEIHAFFPKNLSLRQTIENAWADTFLGKAKLTHDRDEDVNSVLRWFAPELNPNHDPSQSLRVPADEEPMDETASDNDGTESKKPLAPTIVSEEDIEERIGSRRGRISFFSRYYPPEASFLDTLEWAESTRFGDVSFSAQRLLLLLRATVHRPDIVILDEAFSGLSPETRDKAMLFLECGERYLIPPETMPPDSDRARRLSLHMTRYWRGREVARNKMDGQRIEGLGPQQAVICVSHVKEEVPSVVRDWMRLPGEEEEEKPVEMGRFGSGLYAAGAAGWAEIWNGPQLPKEKARMGRARVLEAPQLPKEKRRRGRPLGKMVFEGPQLPKVKARIGRPRKVPVKAEDETSSNTSDIKSSEAEA